MTRLLLIATVMALSACGAARELKPAEGKKLPVAPYGATVTPGADQLLTASTQARPSRSDELLTGSEERRTDEFDLPPAN